jgi:uncharacterized protein YdeI (YjbR/CyaY-like superfamily)
MEAFFMGSQMNPKVDAYIAKAQPFAQPILNHLRQLMHKGCPGLEEALKWSHPFFLYRGTIVAHMVAFKEHCAFGFWGEEIGAVLRDSGYVEEDSKGKLGRITTVTDLPPEKVLLGWVREAAAFIDSGQHTSPIVARNKAVKTRKPAPKASPEFAAALKKNKKAAAVFDAFRPSCKREYVEWIAEAKRDETRDKRIAQAIEWLAEGKQRNWKYQSC